MKQKTNKSAKKRFKITATGKVMRRVASGRHLRRKKSATQRRQFRSHKSVTGPLSRRVKRLIAIA